MSQDRISTCARGRYTRNARRRAQADDHVRWVDVKGFGPNLDTEFGSFGVACHGIIAYSAIVSSSWLEKLIDGVGDVEGEVINRGAAVDDNLDLGRVVGVAEVGEPAADIPIALRALVLESRCGDGVEGVLRLGRGGARGREQLERGAGEDRDVADGGGAAYGEDAGAVTFERKAEEGGDAAFGVHGGDDGGVGYLVGGGIGVVARAGEGSCVGGEGETEDTT